MSIHRFALLNVFFLLPLAAGCSQSHPSTYEISSQKEISYPIEDFTLTERSGKKVSRADFLGKVWIASFVFTRCAGPCPQVTKTMTRLQSELRLAEQPDVRLVTFTVDPERDDPDELRKYADQHHADKEKWLFLTGKEIDIHRLLNDSFKVAALRSAKPMPGSEFDHSARLVVIDKNGNARGYFNGLPDLQDKESAGNEVKKIKTLVEKLLEER